MFEVQVPALNRTSNAQLSTSKLDLVRGAVLGRGSISETSKLDWTKGAPLAPLFFLLDFGKCLLYGFGAIRVPYADALDG